ncbi:MAG: hypothetical protein HYW57_09025 [Ignavibacteriales bacterium]|nr:hypothetical protein [Ignavibacteriales bacterium]
MRSVNHENIAPAVEGWKPDTDRPPVYPGTATPRRPGTPFVDRPRTTKSKRPSFSPFNIMLLLIGMAAGIVLYVSNIIAVNQLLLEINALETEHQQILMDQERLKAQINRMASLERIQEKAEAELGLKGLEGPPVWIEVDAEKIKELEEHGLP